MGKISALQQRFVRIKPGSKVTLAFSYGKYENCQIRNLSLTELFVNGVFPVRKDEYCFVYLFKRKKRVTSCFQATAKVVRRNVFGVGLEFTSMPAESYLFLQELLYGENKPHHVMQELPDNCPFEIQDHRLVSQKPKSASFTLLDNS